MKNQKFELKLDAGFATVPIYDKVDGEKLGEFKFNPSDLDIARRYDYVAEEMGKLSIPEDGSIETLYETTDKIKELIDYLLNCKASDGIFAVANPFTPVSDGDLYIEKVIEGIAGLIEEITEKRIEQKRIKIQKATAKYARGGMKAAVKAANK